MNKIEKLKEVRGRIKAIVIDLEAKKFIRKKNMEQKSLLIQSK